MGCRRLPEADELQPKKVDPYESEAPPLIECGASLYLEWAHQDSNLGPTDYESEK